MQTLYLNNSIIKDFDSKNDNQKINGVIVTEEEKPKKIKYLKTQTKKNPSFFTLYGNSQNNKIECEEDRACIVYGYEGDDEIYQREDFSDFIVRDFGKRNEKDKIILEKGFGDNYKLAYGKLSNTNLGTQISLTYGWVFKTTRTVFLEGVSKGEVKKWLVAAKGQLYSEDNSYNPIKLE